MALKSQGFKNAKRVMTPGGGVLGDNNSKDLDDFIAKHKILVWPDRNGNGDDVFRATNVNYIKRASEKHGYDPGGDEKVYESVQEPKTIFDKVVQERSLTDTELAERNEIVKALKKENNDWTASKIYAAATSKVLRRAEKLHRIDASFDVDYDTTPVVSEDAAALLFKMWKGLDNDNRAIMSEKLETIDGVNDLLEFWLSE